MPAQEEAQGQLQDQAIAEELAAGGDVDVATGAPATAAGCTAQSPAQVLNQLHFQSPNDI